MSASYCYKTSHPSDPVASSLTFECVSSELSMACERPLEKTLRSAVLVTLVSASDRRDPRADTESSHRMPPATPLCSKQTYANYIKTLTLRPSAALGRLNMSSATDSPRQKPWILLKTYITARGPSGADFRYPQRTLWHIILIQFSHTPRKMLVASYFLLYGDI